MRSLAARLILGAGALLALGAAVFFVNHLEQQIRTLRVADRAFDLSSREAAAGLADLRVSQAAYVAAGQGVAFWMPKVTATVADVTQAIAELRSKARNDATRAALDEAGTTIVEFSSVDRRARDYLKSGQQLMAGDVIFTEGDQTASAAAQHVNMARAAEHQAVDTAEVGLRRQQATALAGAAAIVIVALFMLVLVSPRRTAETKTEPLTISGAHSGSSDADLVLRSAPVAASQYVTARPAGPVLRAASQLCTDFGRVSDLDELKTLVGQAADLMDASGFVIWVGSADGANLQPALSHGYTPQVLARMSMIPRSADNAAAAAFRTSQLQIVLARPGESNGAVVAPLLSPDGCVGALSAEIRGGGESSESVQALAAIFAAQLAGVLHSTPAAHEQRSVGTGTI
jgi:GAF domain-containing protein